MLDNVMAVYRRNSGGIHGKNSFVFNRARLIDTYQILGKELNFRTKIEWQKGITKWYGDYYKAVIDDYTKDKLKSKKTIIDSAILSSIVENLIISGIKNNTFLRYKETLNSEFHINKLIEKTKSFIKKQNLDDLVKYKYSNSCTSSNIYSSCYSVMLLSLFGDLDNLNSSEINNWIDYFNSFQDEEDGLFYDRSLYNDIYDEADWWGAKHLAAHIISAYNSLKSKPKFQFKFLTKYYGPKLIAILEKEDWKGFFPHSNDIDNFIMNIGTLLQYQRDHFGDEKAGETVEILLRYLAERIDPETGLWGSFDKDDSDEVSRAVQFGYHLYILFFYDKKEIMYKEKLIDNILRTPNIFGGFGTKFNSSACEDIDSIDLLARLNKITSYKNEEIKFALIKALHWVLSNFNEDGGAVFRRGEQFYYGHQQMSSKINESALFPTWFRILSLAYLSKIFDLNYNFRIINSPGYTFWHSEIDEKNYNIKSNSKVEFISVIIPTRNRADRLACALESLLNQTIPQNKFEVIIVDNASEDKTKEVAKLYLNRFTSLKYFYEPELGLHNCRHKGMLEAKSDILVFCDDDIEAAPGWLEAISESFEDEEVMLAGGKNLPKWEILPPPWIMNMWETIKKYGKSLGYLSILDFGNEFKEVEPDYVWGLNFAVRKPILFEARGFHPDGMPQHLIKFRGDGESHVAQYIKSMGYKTVYNPKARIYHIIPEERLSLEYFKQRAFNQGVSDSYTFIRNHKKFQLKKKLTASSTPTHYQHEINNSYVEGYNFHQQCVNNDPSLFNWVIKESYFETSLISNNAGNHKNNNKEKVEFYCWREFSLNDKIFYDDPVDAILNNYIIQENKYVQNFFNNNETVFSTDNWNVFLSSLINGNNDKLMSESNSVDIKFIQRKPDIPQVLDYLRVLKNHVDVFYHLNKLNILKRHFSNSLDLLENFNNSELNNLKESLLLAINEIK